MWHTIQRQVLCESQTIETAAEHTHTQKVGGGEVVGWREREKQEEKEISNPMQRNKERKNTIKGQERIVRNCFFFPEGILRTI